MTEDGSEVVFGQCVQSLLLSTMTKARSYINSTTNRNQIASDTSREVAFFFQFSHFYFCQFSNVQQSTTP